MKKSLQVVIIISILIFVNVNTYQLKKDLNNIRDEVDYMQVKQSFIETEVIKLKTDNKTGKISRGSSREEIISSEEVILLARIIQAEALGEPFEGKLAVGEVILNRVKSDDFPNSIEEVIFEIGQFCGLDTRLFVEEPHSECIKAAEMVLTGKTNEAKGALYFMNRYEASREAIRWADNRLTFIRRIGNHWFYK